MYGASRQARAVPQVPGALGSSPGYTQTAKRQESALSKTHGLRDVGVCARYAQSLQGPVQKTSTRNYCLKSIFAVYASAWTKTAANFAHFSYDDSLTYEALLEVEEDLTRDVELLLERAGAAHLDFTPWAMPSCSSAFFEAHRLYVYRKIALEIAALLPQGVRGRLLCIDKNFESMHVFWLRSGEWQEEERPVPPRPASQPQTWRIAWQMLKMLLTNQRAKNKGQQRAENRAEGNWYQPAGICQPHSP